MAYFPMFINLTDSDCLIVGGGKVAYRKIKVLLDFGARVHVVAKDISKEVKLLSQEADCLFLEQREFKPSDLDNKCLVVAATTDYTLNSQIASLCNDAKIPVNVVDCSQLCTFIFPSYIKEQDLVGAFSSSGKSPVITQILRDQTKEIFNPKLGKINELLGQWRSRLIKQFPSEAARKKAIRHLIDFALSYDGIPSDDQIEKELHRLI